MLSFNSYWYVGLASVSIILLSYVFIKTKSVRSVLLFLTLVECVYLFETIIYIFGSSYEYHPKIIKYDSYYDSNLGAISSNMFAVPALGTLVATFDLNWSWILVIIGMLAGIEWLFIKLQIYTLYWWRIEYSAIGFLVFFPVAKLLYKSILQPLKGKLHSLCLFLCIAPIAGTLHITPIMLLANREYLPGWFENPAQDTTAFASIYYLCVSCFIVVLVKLRLKYRYFLLPMALVAVTVILERMGILYSLVWWDKWFYFFGPLIVLTIGDRISRYLSKASNT